ncbi:MAG: hypothetical protein Athens101428_494 [Candidatus Berkelbacteria bacterium Athens1014_28]|uniref:Uncharacterized protein n=1 Tax=Candidatus Berkelbacteria bacterium Athens1014_28 TaxID=2017145 RepID=A0A554LLU9_9BACT|nr:MAG: hypothetical protein Athens101428_494 [Candidatus Berkelbacteria bacterium Athens1014_28]
MESGKSIGEEYADWKAEGPKAESPKEEDVWADEAPKDDPETMPKPTKPEFVGRRYGEEINDRTRNEKLENFAREIAVFLADNFISGQRDLTPKEQNELSILRSHIAEAHKGNPTMNFGEAFEEAARYMERMDPEGGKKFRQEHYNEMEKARGIY